MEPGSISYYYYGYDVDYKPGPFKPYKMKKWYNEGHFPVDLIIEIICDINAKTTANFTTTLDELCRVYGSTDPFPSECSKMNSLLGNGQKKVDIQGNSDVPAAAAQNSDVQLDNDKNGKVGATSQVPSAGTKHADFPNVPKELAAQNTSQQNKGVLPPGCKTANVKKVECKAYIPYCTGRKADKTTDGLDCKTMTEYGKSLFNTFLWMQQPEKRQLLEKLVQFQFPNKCHLCDAILRTNNEAFSHFLSGKHIANIYESGNVLTYENDYLALETIIKSVIKPEKEVLSGSCSAERTDDENHKVNTTNKVQTVGRMSLEQNGIVMPTVVNKSAASGVEKEYVPFCTGIKGSPVIDGYACTTIANYAKSLLDEFLRMHPRDKNQFTEQLKLPNNCHLCNIEFKKSTDAVHHFLSRKHIYQVYESGNVLTYEKDYIVFKNNLESLKNREVKHASRIEDFDENDNNSSGSYFNNFTPRKVKAQVTLERRKWDMPTAPKSADSNFETDVENNYISYCKVIGKSIYFTFLGMNNLEQMKILEKFEQYGFPNSCSSCNFYFKTSKSAVRHLLAKKHIDKVPGYGNVGSYEKYYRDFERFMEDVKEGTANQENVWKKLEKPRNAEESGFFFNIGTADGERIERRNRHQKWLIFGSKEQSTCPFERKSSGGFNGSRDGRNSSSGFGSGDSSGFGCTAEVTARPADNQRRVRNTNAIMTFYKSEK